MQRFIAIACALLCSGLAACSGEPFRLDPSGSETEPRARGGPGRPVRESRPLPPSNAASPVLPKIEFLFARRGIDELVVLDGQGDEPVASRTLSGPLVDLDWNGERLLAVTAGTSGDTSRVEVWSVPDPTANEWLSCASHDALPEQTRALGFGPWWLLLGEDMGTSWTLLDSALAPLAPSKLLVRPSGLFVVPTRDGVTAVALNPSLLVAGQDADEIVSARFESSWKIEHASFDATGRPDSRLAHREGSDVAWVVRKPADGITFQLGQFLAVDPSAPQSFETRIVAGATGALQAVVVDETHARLIALLSRGEQPGALALVPLAEEAKGTVVALSAAVESSPWFSRQLLLEPSGMLSVATAAGIEQLRVADDGLVAERTLAGLGAPLVSWGP
jgi:hypothetical protein